MTQPGREGPLSIASLVDEVSDTVRGYIRHQDQVTSLTAPIGSADLTIPVADATGISKGLIEIEDELVQVQKVDQNAGTVTLEPWGRGQSGSAAVAHASGVRVTSFPLYPRQRVRSAIFGVLREVFPDVFAVKTTTLTGNPAKWGYVMPADCYKVISVYTRNIYDTNAWIPIRRWRTSGTETQVELDIIGPVTPGANSVRVTYIRTPPDELDQAVDLAAFGYGYELRDLIVLGSSAKLLAYTEPARIQVQTMEAAGRSEVVSAGSATTVARMLFQMFRARIDDERRQLQMRFPIQPHMTR